MTQSSLTPRINAIEEDGGGPILATTTQEGAVSTTTQTFAGNKTWQGTQTLGASGETGAHVFNGHARFGGHGVGTPAYSFAGQQNSIGAAANADFTLGSSFATGSVGFLVVYSVRSGNGAFTTMTTYSLLNNGLTTGAVTQVSTATGASGPSAFTVAVNSQSPNVIRVNNTSGQTANISIAFFGLVAG